MLQSLQDGLHHRNGLVRKGCAFLLRGPRRYAHFRAAAPTYELTPPVLANSFPKSGTHLLDQIMEALPGRRNFGEFLSSMTSSFSFRPRPVGSILSAIRGSAPGEIVRAHLYADSTIASALRENGFVHYFIYRDPRDVVLSESHYLRSLNRWHRLHPYFRDAPTLDDAITLSIQGLPELAPKIDYPNVKARFDRYARWITSNDVCAVRFEDLISEQRAETLFRMAEYYVARSTADLNVEEIVEAMQASIDPHRSHTYRKAESGGWRKKFSEEHHRLFEEFAGDLLRQYEFV